MLAGQVQRRQQDRDKKRDNGGGGGSGNGGDNGGGGGNGNNNGGNAVAQIPYIRASYGFNPEYGLYALRYDLLPAPSEKMLAYEGWAGVQTTVTGSGGGIVFGSFGDEVWIDGHQATYTHFPPGNRRNANVNTTAVSSLIAHLTQNSDSDQHIDLFGDWTTNGQFNAFARIQGDFVRRHGIGGDSGNIIFVDGHAEPRRNIDPQSMNYPDGIR